MAFKAIDADEITPTWGTFRMVRHELGATAFGLNQIDFPPDKVGSEHDEAQSGQEEIYYTISGSGTLRSTARMSRCGPAATSSSRPTRSAARRAGPGGLSFICVGGVPGGVYEPWAPPDE